VKLVLQVLLTLSGICALVLLWRSRQGNRPSQAQLALLILVAGGLAADTAALNPNPYFRLAVVTAFMGVFAVRLGWRNPVSVTRFRLGAAILALWGWLFVVDILGGSIGPGEAAAPLTAFSVMALCAFATSPSGIDTRLVARTVLMVIAVIAVLGPVTSTAWRSCDQFKCSLAGALFMGPFPSENELGIQALFVLAWALIGLRGLVRQAAILMSLLLFAVTDARTSLLAGAICVTAYVCLRPGGQGITRRGARIGFPGAAVFGVGSVVTGFLLVELSGPQTFSNRGGIWTQARALFAQHPLRGLGLHQWFVLQGVGLLPQHFAHSQYLLLMFAGGLVALSLYAVILGSALQHLVNRPKSRLPDAIPVIALAVIGLTEVAWNPLTFDGSTWPILAILLVAPRIQVRRGARAATGPPPSLYRTPDGDSGSSLPSRSGQGGARRMPARRQRTTLEWPRPGRPGQAGERAGS